MPSIVATHLGIKGVVVTSVANEVDSMSDTSKVVQVGETGGVSIPHIKAFEKQPRGGLTTFAKLTEQNKWLRSRNSLLRDFGMDGRTRVLICEGGVCKEETDEVDVGGLEDSTAAFSIGEKREVKPKTMPESKIEPTVADAADRLPSSTIDSKAL